MSAGAKGRSLPAILMALNALLWCGLLGARKPLSQSYFDARDARAERTTKGVSFHEISDVDPFLILAERPIVYPQVGVGDADVLGGIALVANLPAVLLTALVVLPVTVEPAFGGIGWRAASWMQTVAFALASSAQWCAVGYCVTAFNRWRRERRESEAALG